MINMQTVLDELKNYDGDVIRIMEVCGTHTNSIHKNGIPSLLSDKIKLISGPGCPVCVTGSGYIDRICEIAKQENTVVYTFGDMIRVPGKDTSLAEIKATGGRVEIMYSPTEVFENAKLHPKLNFYVAAVGFETTIAVYTILLDKIVNSNIRNVKFLTSLKAIIPALNWLCATDHNIDGFIGPGHVSVILGSDVYKPVCKKYEIPMAIAGFEAEHVLLAIYDLIQQHKKKTSYVHNLYKSVVSDNGNVVAHNLIDKYFQLEKTSWRGVGSIDGSGYFLKPEYAEFDAGSKIAETDEVIENGCMCGSVIIGKVTPDNCPLFGTVCTPLKPKGACMVSSEGTCSVFYQNGVRR